MAKKTKFDNLVKGYRTGFGRQKKNYAGVIPKAPKQEPTTGSSVGAYKGPPET